MEKRNVIEQGRTPDFKSQDRMDDVEKAAASQFNTAPLTVTAKPAGNSTLAEKIGRD